MLSIFTVFVIGKLFLWSKYAAWKTANYGDDYQAPNAVTVPEHAIGNTASVAESIADNDDEPEAQPAKVPFGFTGSKAAAASSADRNRALHERVDTRTCNNTHDSLHERVNTRTCNNTHDPLHERVGNSSGKSTNYDSAANAKVGSMIDCPQCGTTFRKSNKWHTFCCSSCKDNWHNERDPSRLEALKAIKRRKSA